MKKIFILFLIMIVLTSISVSSINIIDYEDFQDLPEFRTPTPNNNYNAYNNEGEGNSITNDNMAFIGSITDYNITTTQILFTPQNEMYFNRIFLSIGNTINSPESKNYIYNISICETNATNLTTNLNDCTTEYQNINYNFKLSDVWGSGNGVKEIPTKEVFLETGKKYILKFDYVSGDLSSLNEYSINYDKTNVNRYLIKVIRNNGNSIKRYKRVINFTIYYAKNDIGNINAYNKKWDCADNTQYPSCASSGTGQSDYSINKVGNNKYLYMESILGDSTPKILKLQRDFINSTPLQNLINNTQTLYYKIRRAGSSFNLAYANKHFAGVYGSNIITRTSPSTRYFVGFMGGRTINNESLWNNLRSETDTNFITHPLNSSCDIDHNWNYVSEVLKFDDTNLKTIDTYVNGVLCNVNNVNKQQSNTTPLFDYLRFYVAGNFQIELDDIYLIEGEYTDEITTPQETTIENLTVCPYPECIFYDAFNYDNNHNLINEGYYNFDNSLNNFSIISNNMLYLNKQTYYNYIRHDFNENDYKKIVGVYNMFINAETTPDSLQNGLYPLIYKLSVYCDDDSIFNSIYMVFIKDETFAVTENQTIVNVYVYDDGSQRILGTLLIDNGQEFYIKAEHDLNEQNTKYSFITDDLLQNGYAPNYLFSVDDILSCSKPKGFEIKKIDGNINNTDFAKFDLIYYAGITETKQDKTYITFNGSNAKSTIDDLDGTEINKEDITDSILKVIWDLGFRSETAKLLLWLFILVLIYLAVGKLDLSPVSRGYLLVTVGVVYMFIGWKMTFIPTILMVMLSILIAIIGAIALQRILQNSGGV